MSARISHPLLGALLVAAGLTGAVAAPVEGFYAGAGLGGQSYPDRINGNTTSGTALSGKLFGGYQINPNFAVEGGITELGALNSPGGQVDSYGTFVDAVGILPLNNQWSLLGRAGVAHMAINTPTGDDGGNGLKVGLGAEYALSKTMAIRGEWERYPLTGFGNNPSADQFTVGVKVGF
jgi:OOP family OmpA-OmpF porin